MVRAAGAAATGERLPLGVTCQPALSMGPPLAVSPTKPVTSPLAVVSVRAGRLVAATAPPEKVTWKPVSFSVPVPPHAATVTVPAPRMASRAASMSAVV